MQENATPAKVPSFDGGTAARSTLLFIPLDLDEIWGYTHTNIYKMK
jgi:hypothetical protein